MNIQIPIYQDFADFFIVRTKTISRIAIADIMDKDMLIRWYQKVIDSNIAIKNLRGIGYFESSFSHGYIMATRRYNLLSIDVIKFQLNLRDINSRNNRKLNYLENIISLNLSSDIK